MLNVFQHLFYFLYVVCYINLFHFPIFYKMCIYAEQMQRCCNAIDWHCYRRYWWNWSRSQHTTHAAYFIFGTGSYATHRTWPLQAATAEPVGEFEICFQVFYLLTELAERMTVMLKTYEIFCSFTLFKMISYWVYKITCWIVCKFNIFVTFFLCSQIVLAEHNDHLMVARILLNSDTTKLALGLTIPQLAVITHNFTGKFYFYIFMYPSFNFFIRIVIFA